MQKVQKRQNHAIRLIFFTRTLSEFAAPLLNLLELLTKNNVNRLHALRFNHLRHKKLFPNVFHDFFQYASNLHTCNTRYVANQNLYEPGLRKNTGKQIISYMASVFWHNILSNVKNLDIYQFSKQIMLYLFSDLIGSI